ncbi:restriction endonuclease subunit S [Halomonas sp. G11]|uniref:restriction endonuclease subunit S n=1 Tax=Halomonas sp. G11 TaxID=1684425 RepID=UPI0007FC3EB2|nr:restriction endonuclease subunit S [Halomonas sp. G11]OAZ91386.1 hypothetical protein ADS46_05945 [Halomonas sp. G11]
MNWTTVKLVEVASIERKGVDPSAIESGTNYLGLEHIQSGGRIIGRKKVLNGELASTKFSFSHEHILYGKLRPYLSKIALPDFDGVCSTDILPIRPGPKIDKKFLAYFLRQPSMVDYATSRSTGANLPRLSPKTLAEFDVPLLPLDEQTRIAAILDQANELCYLRQNAIKKLNLLNQSIFYEMFGNPVINPKKWDTEKLAKLGSLDRGISKYRPRNDPVLLGGEHPLIQTGDVSSAQDYITSFSSTYSDIGLAQSKKWPAGTVCITIAANIADTAILDFDACFPDSVVAFNAENHETNFFIHVWFKLTKGELDRIAPAVAQKNINLSILRNLDVIWPGQNAVKNFYKKCQAIHDLSTQAQALYKKQSKLFASLQQRAFRGEL